MAKGEIPPVKDRLDMALATQKTDSGLTLSVIRTLHKQVFYFFVFLYLSLFFYALQNIIITKKDQ